MNDLHQASDWLQKRNIDFLHFKQYVADAQNQKPFMQLKQAGNRIEKILSTF
jgi:hypothetical protein